MLASPLKVDPSRRMLHPPYEDLFQVLERQDHSFKLDLQDGLKWVSLWRLKAFAKPWGTPKSEASGSATTIGGITFRAPPLNPRGFSWQRH